MQMETVHCFDLRHLKSTQREPRNNRKRAYSKQTSCLHSTNKIIGLLSNLVSDLVNSLYLLQYIDI